VHLLYAISGHEIPLV
jgi:hypothetical protein